MVEYWNDETRAKPSFANLGNEVKITLVSSSAPYAGMTGAGLIDGAVNNEWNTANVFYWGAATTNLVVTFPTKVNIYRAGATGYSQHTGLLSISRLNADNTYTDITPFIPQKVTNIGSTAWEKTIAQLPAGTYKFVKQGTKNRLDSCWYVEEAIADAVPREIVVSKMLKENIPPKLPKQTVIFTEDKDILVTKSDGEAVSMFDFLLGIPLPFGSLVTKIPKGFLLCDGAELDRTDFARLFECLGTTYNQATDTDETKFRLPDLRGKFLRGVGGNSAELGIEQGDAIRNITAYWQGLVSLYPNASVSGAGYFAYSSQNAKYTSGTGGGSVDPMFNASRVVPTANENRPVNIAMNYIMKY